MSSPHSAQTSGRKISMCAYIHHKFIHSRAAWGITLSLLASVRRSSFPRRRSLLCLTSTVHLMCSLLHWQQGNVCGCRPQISRSSGGTLRTLPISSLAPATSCELGLYVPSDWRFFRAVMTRKNTTRMASNTHRVVRGMVTTSQGTSSLCLSFCKRVCYGIKLIKCQNRNAQ